MMVARLALAVLLALTTTTAAATSPKKQPANLVCHDCVSPAAKKLWWPKTGLNCPKDAPQGSCDICDQTQQTKMCEAATTPEKCCELCRQWNTDTLPEKDAVGAKSGKICGVWYFNGGSCLLKDGGFTAAEFEPVSGDQYVSGPGCTGSGGWGFPFLITLLCCGVCYVGGTGLYNLKVLGQDPKSAFVPHPEVWLGMHGLVLDGCMLAMTTVKKHVSGGAGYTELAEDASASKKLKATADTGVPGTDEAGDEGGDNSNGGGSEDDTKSDTDMAE